MDCIRLKSLIDGYKSYISIISGILLLAIILRLLGIGYGLPAVFPASENHMVSVAVSFGSGDLNPHHFKYPTLWMYLLFFAYGNYFLLLRFLGMVHSVQEFGWLFVADPTAFFLIGRILSALFSVAGIYVVYRCALAIGEKNMGLWAAALLTVSPAMVQSGHGVRPECLMFFFSACSWLWGIRIIHDGKMKSYLLTGAFLGLALSSQYTALPVLSLLIGAHFLRMSKSGENRSVRQYFLSKRLWAAFGAAFVAMFFTSPFIFLDFPAFLSWCWDLRSQLYMEKIIRGLPIISPGPILATFFTFAGKYSFSALGLLIGLWLLWQEKRQPLYWLAPILVILALNSLSPFGGEGRYNFAIFPALAVISGFGLEKIRQKIPGWTGWILILLVFAPGAVQTYYPNRNLLLPDTRTIAKRWIYKNILAGSRILMGQRNEGPDLRISRKQAERLYEKTLSIGHARSQYYKLILDSHPGGGYEIFRIKRTAFDLISQTGRAEWSQKGYEMIAVTEGLKPVLEAGIEYVVIPGYGESLRTKSLSRFLSELDTKGNLIKRFIPKKGKITGPEISVYHLR